MEWLIVGVLIFVGLWFVKVIRHMRASMKLQDEMMAVDPSLSLPEARKIADEIVADKMVNRGTSK